MKTAEQWASETAKIYPRVERGYMEKMFEKAMQAQHEATWAMALEAAAKCSKELRDEHKCETMLYAQHHIHVSAIGALPCPPLDGGKRLTFKMEFPPPAIVKVNCNICGLPLYCGDVPPGVCKCPPLDEEK